MCLCNLHVTEVLMLVCIALYEYKIALKDNWTQTYEIVD